MDDKIIGEGKLNEGVIRERKRELNELAVEPEVLSCLNGVRNREW